MTRTADFEYSFHEGFYSVMPNTDDARRVINKLIESTGSNKLLVCEFERFRRQARKHGYSVRKFRPQIIGADHLAELLSAK